MKKNRAIKRMFLSLMWIGVAAGMVTLITAAIKVQNTNLCKGYDINITGSQDGKLFTSKENIIQLLKEATKGEIKGQHISSFNLPQIEDLLEQSAWVNNAELYFDNRDILRVNVIERKPLARAFTTNGESFYIDEVGKQIPLSEKISLDVPVFTGYPAKKIWNAEDSALVQNVIATASFINNDAFWSSQVSQINIRHEGMKGWKMEMVPVVGNHRVQLGDGNDIATKFHRLYLFYDQVLKTKGFDKYQTIDVQYNGQVLGVKGNYTKIDSLQLRKNIENLLLQARNANELISEMPNTTSGNYIIDSVSQQESEQMAMEPAMDDTLAVAPLPAEKPVVKAPVAIPVKNAEPVKKEETKPAPAKKNDVKKEDKHPVVSAKKEAAKAIPKKEVKKETKPDTKKETKPAVKPKLAKPSAKKETAGNKTKPPVKKAEPKADSKKPAVKPAPAKKETKPVTNKKTTTTKKTN